MAITHDHPTPDGATSHVATDHAPGYQLLASLGKKVLRPGGIELTDKLLDELAIGPDDDVVELAPGMGSTTERVLAAHPKSYTGVDRDPAAEATVPKLFDGPGRSFTRGSVSRTGLPDASCDVVFGEAYLSMHPDNQKRRIVEEVARIVHPGGRIGLHEVAFQPKGFDTDDGAGDAEKERILAELQNRFKVAFNAMPLHEWETMLTDAGFVIGEVHFAPLRLLEIDRIIADEGLVNTAKFAFNVARRPEVFRRLRHMRATMHRNAQHLTAFALTATRVAD